MSWSNCGEDKQGRKIGYAHEATCDHDGCKSIIDRGLSYACGGEHGETERGCEKYFCSEHLDNCVEDDGDFWRVCDDCAKALIDSGEWSEDDGSLVRVVD